MQTSLVQAQGGEMRLEAWFTVGRVEAGRVTGESEQA